MKKTLAMAAVTLGAVGFVSVASAQVLSNQAEVWQRQAEAVGNGVHSQVGPQYNAYEAARQADSYNRAEQYNRDRWERNDRFRNDRFRADRYANRDRYVRPYPEYSYNHPRFYRGGYLPYEYRQPAYYINDWSAYPGLYAPPYGYQWMQVGDDFLLVALASGLIANLLTAQ